MPGTLDMSRRGAARAAMGLAAAFTAPAAAFAAPDLLDLGRKIGAAAARLKVAQDAHTVQEERYLAAVAALGPKPKLERSDDPDVPLTDADVYRHQDDMRAWNRRRAALDADPDYCAAQERQDAADDILLELTGEVADFPARTLADLIVKARMVEHDEEIAASIVRDLLAMRAA